MSKEPKSIMVTREMMPRSCWGGQHYVQIYVRTDDPGHWAPTRSDQYIQSMTSLHVGNTIKSAGPRVLAKIMDRYPHIPAYASTALASDRCLELATDINGRSVERMDRPNSVIPAYYSPPA